MTKTTEKGDYGVAMVIADVKKRGYKIALPMGEDWPFDLIVQRDNKLERIQCKYTESDGAVIKAKCGSTSGYVNYKYTAEHIDWIAVYDKTTDKCYYIDAHELGEGKNHMFLRLTPTKSGRVKVTWAKDYELF